MLNKRFLVPLLVLAGVQAASADVIKQVVNVTMDFDGSITNVDVPRFSPLLGTLNRVRVYSCVRANGTFFVENIDSVAGAGAASFSLGLNISVATGVGDYYVQFNGARSKMSKVSLAAFDGTSDFAGPDSWSRTFSTSAGADAGWLSDPLLLGFVTGVGPITLKLQGGYQTYWQSLSTGFPRPQQVVQAKGTQTVVIFYDYTPAIP